MNVDANTILIRSAFGPDLCISRISSALYKDDGFWPRMSPFPNEPSPVGGEVAGFSMRLHRVINYRNSFQTILAAEVRPDGIGSKVVGKCGLHPVVKVVVVAWIGVMILTACVAGIASIAGTFGLHQAGGDHDAGIGSPSPVQFGIMIFGCGVFCFCRYLARDDQRVLTDFLLRVVSEKRVN